MNMGISKSISQKSRFHNKRKIQDKDVNKRKGPRQTTTLIPKRKGKIKRSK
jgi:hypothetical protein